jgi:hypothetical protein
MTWGLSVHAQVLLKDMSGLLFLCPSIAFMTVGLSFHARVVFLEIQTFCIYAQAVSLESNGNFVVCCRRIGAGILALARG